MDIKINHDKAQNRFVALNENEIVGIIEYLIEGNTISVIHTGVVPKYEGLGIAAILNKALLEYAIQKQGKIKPLCSYTKRYIERHIEYACLLSTKEL